MREMIRKISKEMDEMNSISKKVIKYGVEISLILSFIALMGSVLNTHLLGNMESLATNSIFMFKSSISLLAIAVVSGLVMDFAHKRG